MLHSILYRLPGAEEPAADVSADQESILRLAVSVAGTALSLVSEEVISDWIWTGANGESVDIRQALTRPAAADRLHALRQVDDFLFAEQDGFIKVKQHADLAALILDEDVCVWCSAHTRQSIEAWRRMERALLDELRSDFREITDRSVRRSAKLTVRVENDELDPVGGVLIAVGGRNGEGELAGGETGPDGRVVLFLPLEPGCRLHAILYADGDRVGSLEIDGDGDASIVI